MFFCFLRNKSCLKFKSDLQCLNKTLISLLVEPNNYVVATDKLLELEPNQDMNTKISEKCSEEIAVNNNLEKINLKETPKRVYDLVWFNIIGFAVLHLMALYGLYLCFQCHFLTVVWGKWKRKLQVLWQYQLRSKLHVNKYGKS